MNATERRLRALNDRRWQKVRATWEPLHEAGVQQAPWFGVGFGLLSGFLLGRQARTGSGPRAEKARHAAADLAAGRAKDAQSSSYSAPKKSGKKAFFLRSLQAVQRWSVVIMPLIRAYAAAHAPPAPTASESPAPPPGV